MRKRGSSKFLYLIVGSLGAFGLTSGAKAAYNVIGLGTLGGTSSSAAAINNNGEIVGWSTTASSATHAFVYNGTMIDLLPSSVSSAAYGLNDLGQIVGGSVFTGSTSHAFVDTGGSVSDLSSTLDGSNSGSSKNSAATGINQSGQIVGVYQGSSSASTGSPNINGVAFVYNGTTLTPIDQFINESSNGPDKGFASAINNSGQVVGSMVSEVSGGGNYIAFVSNSASAATDLNKQTANYNQFSGNNAYGINSSGLIVGTAQSAGGSSPYVPADWNNGGAYLPTLGGQYGSANAVNDSGVIVGESTFTPGTGNFHAFIYSGGIITDLNSLIPANSGWVLNGATGINNAGTIIGDGTFNGQSEAFELTVPEPASIGLIAIGGWAMLARRRRCAV